EGELFPNYDMDLDRNKFLSAFFQAEVDRRDQKYYPTSGFDLNAKFNYYLNKPFGSGFTNFSAIQAHFSGVVPFGDRVAFILSLDNRTLIGKEVPLIYGNFMGGFVAGRYLDHQIPFLGFTHTHLFKNVLAIATLDTRARIFDNHYVYASASYAQDFVKIKEAFQDTPVIGVRLGYSYNSVIGPLSADVIWSNYAHAVGAYVSIGYTF
ncbi:MAG: hypothetical protein ACSW72_07350, partial [Bacteroidales bacterium]